MKSDYWNVTDEQVIEKTGKKIAEWMKILGKFKAAEKNQMRWLLFFSPNTRYPAIGPAHLRPII